MKKLVYILFVCISPIFSQENATTITVIGEADKQVEVGTYHLTIALKQIKPGDFQHLGSISISLERVRQTYSDKLMAIGVDFSEFKENFPVRFYMTYSKMNDVAYYSYETTSGELIQKIIKQDMDGLTSVDVEIVAKEKTAEELVDLTDVAIGNAKITAQKLANKLHKKLGNILTIVDSNSKEQYLDIYKLNILQKHPVTVTFELK